MHRPTARQPHRARGRALASAAALIAALASAASASAAAEPTPEILKTDPYYLSLYEGRGEDRGTVLTLHGGGWRGDFGPRADAVMHDYIGLITGWGYDVANLGYRGGAQSIDDALAAWDLLRDRLGPDERFCIFGGSAGGHLALTVAARRGTEVDCVIDYLGPPDLADWGSAPAAEVGLRLATEAFGEERLDELSPINFLDEIDSPVLVAAAPCDAFIEIGAQREFADALNRAGGDARLQVIATGDDVAIGHCAVSRASFARFEDAAQALLAGRSAGPVDAPSDGDGGVGVTALLAGVVVLGGLGLLAWSLRRRA